MLPFWCGVPAVVKEGLRVRRFYVCYGVMRMRKLTPKQEKFIQEYLVDHNGTQAAIRAGYKARSAKSTASYLLTNPDLLARVHEAQAAQAKQLCVDKNFVLMELLDTYRCCRAPTPVTKRDPLTGEMVETGEYQFDSRGANRALELIGKELGMFNDKLQLSGTINTGQLDNVLKQLRGGSDG